MVVHVFNQSSLKTRSTKQVLKQATQRNPVSKQKQLGALIIFIPSELFFCQVLQLCKMVTNLQCKMVTSQGGQCCSDTMMKNKLYSPSHEMRTQECKHRTQISWFSHQNLLIKNANSSVFPLLPLITVMVVSLYNKVNNILRLPTLVN